MVERVSSVAHKVASLFSHDNHTMYDDPKVLGEQPFDVPGEVVHSLEREDIVLKSDSDLITALEDENSPTRQFIKRLQAPGKVVAIFRMSPSKVGAYVADNKLQIGGAVVTAAAAVTGILLFREHESKKQKEQEQTEEK